MNSKNAVIEFLFNQLQQQLTNNPYKKQCEDLAHEVQSLKNQLRDMSELVDELLGTITLMNGKSSRRKEDTHECDHDWVLDEKGDYFVCTKCGKQEAELNDCQHTNTVGLRKGFAPGFTKKCLDCGAKLR